MPDPTELSTPVSPSRLSRRDFIKLSAGAGAALALQFGGVGCSGPEQKTPVTSLPYSTDALAPHISERTVEFHYDKHHKGYARKLAKQINGSPYAHMGLEDIILRSAADRNAAVFNLSAQVYNHNLYWHSMRPDGGGKPPEALAARMKADFGDVDNALKEFAAAASGRFGSGWAWLVEDNGKLAILSTSNAATPLTSGQTPLLVIDVWEHAYYLDYQNRRGDYIDSWLENLVNWEFAAGRLSDA